MMTKIVQFVTHEADQFKPYFDHNKRFAKKYKMGYELIIFKMDNRYRWVTAYSDYLRIKYLSENPDTVFLCWDAILLKKPNLKNPFKVRDTILYNGNSCRIYKLALKRYSDYCKKNPLYYLERHRLWKILNTIDGFRLIDNLSKDFYIHSKNINFKELPCKNQKKSTLTK